MENITTGHWIFAGIFMAIFIGYLFWGYRKDLKLHRTHYQGSFYFIAALIVIIFAIFVFKRLF